MKCQSIIWRSVVVEKVAEKVKENLYQATYLGSGTFIISKPKRSKKKMRQLRLKSPGTGMRK
jgi:hypothetical protein